MSAIANIAIQDGKDTPETHTFYPIQTTDPVVYRESLANTALIGNGVINIQDKPGKNGLDRCVISMYLPVLETVTDANASGYTAAPKEAYRLTVKCEFILPSRATVAQRKDLRVLLMDLFTDAQLIDLIDERRKPY